MEIEHEYCSYLISSTIFQRSSINRPAGLFAAIHIPVFICVSADDGKKPVSDKDLFDIALSSEAVESAKENHQDDDDDAAVDSSFDLDDIESRDKTGGDTTETEVEKPNEGNESKEGEMEEKDVEDDEDDSDDDDDDYGLMIDLDWEDPLDRMEDGELLDDYAAKEGAKATGEKVDDSKTEKAKPKSKKYLRQQERRRKRRGMYRLIVYTCSRILKAADKSKRMTRTVLRLSNDIRISLFTKVRAVTVECFFL